MIVEKLVAELAARGVNVSVEGEKLRVRAPEGAISPDLRAQMKAERDALFAFLATPDHDEPYLPSSGQRRLWALERMTPERVTYNVLCGFRLEGALDVSAFEAAFAALVARHAAFRTRFADAGGEPIALVAPAGTPRGAIALAVVDAPAGSDPHALMASEARKPFAVDGGVLTRATLFRLADDDHLLVLVQHHLVTDGASLGVAGRDLAALYAGRTLSERPLPFSAYAEREHALLRSDEAAAKRAHWKGALAGVPILQLPTTGDEAAKTDDTNVLFDLPAALVARAKAFSREEGVTLFTTLFTAYASVLHRYSRQADFGVGSFLGNRTSDDLADVVGFFANTVVLRADFRGAPTFREALGRARSVVTGALTHQDLPYEEIVRASGAERGHGKDPLVRATIELASGLVAKLETPGLRWQILVAPDGGTPGTAKFDLGLAMIELGDTFACKLEFDPTLFARDFVERMASHFATLLDAALTAPDTRVDDLALLTGDEAARIVRAGSDTAAPFPADTCAHALFEAQARRTPDAIAVAFGDTHLTFAALDARANQLAHYLLKRGASVDTLVGLSVERGLGMAVAILGILKAGAAYLPIDPSYPAKRIAYLREDSRAAWTIVAHADDASEIGLDDAATRAAIDAEPTTAPVVAVGPQNLVYVIYTSGSTGQPKGVAITHAGLVNYLTWAGEAYGTSRGAGAPVHSSLSFDLTVTSLWTPWLAGRAALLLPEGEGASALEAALLAQAESGAEPFSLVKLTPAHLAVLNTRFAPGAAKGSAHALVVGGEALFAETVAGWQKASGGTSLVINEYGPTETVVGCAVFRAEDAGQGAVPIGKAIANTELYVLDARLRLVPVGVPGELYIGGAGVARGYFGRPGLTAEKFVASPFTPGARLYRTGDLARLRSDGELEYLGRIDDQVKVRGYRIELGEIEAAIADLPNVHGVAVIVRDGRLVAFVAGLAEDAAAGIRDALRDRLPEYMIPALVIALDTLPLTPNGKVDRAALPVDATARPALTKAFAAPQSDREEALAKVWRELLRLERVGVNDDFFEIGGDSIVAIQMVSRALTAGIRVTPHQVFELRTIAALARAGADDERAGTRSAGATAVTGDVALTPIQRWFFEVAQEAPAHFNQAALVRLHDGVDLPRLETALATVVAHHDAFRLRFAPTSAGGAIAQHYATTPSSAAFAIERWSVESEAELAERATKLHASLGLEAGPVARAAIADVGGARALVFVVHHLVVDGVSWRILLEDLALAYEGAELPARTASFKDWATALEAYAHSPALEAQRAYWAAVAAAPAARLPLTPGDDTVAAETSVVVTLDEARTQALLQRLPRAIGASVHEILVATLGDALLGSIGGDRVRIGVEGHGREEHVVGDVDVSRTVGWFTSLYPVVLERGATLASVRDMLRAVPDRGLGYGVLRYLAKPPVDAAPADVTFNYLGYLDALATGIGEVSLTDPASGKWRSDRLHRREALAIDAWVSEGRFTARWSFDARADAATLERIAEAFTTALATLVDDVEGERARVMAGDVVDAYPLTSVQEGMLFHALLAPKSGLYHEQFALTVEGTLDVATLEAAFRAVVARHPILRTSFAWEGLRRPMQRVHRDVPVVVHEHAAGTFDTLLATRRAEGFDLAKAPLFTIDVVREANEGASASRILLGFHHILLDGWSTAQVFADVFHAYAHGSLAPAPSLAFSELVAWRERQDRGAAEAWFKKALAGFRAPTPLFTDRTDVAGDAPKRQLLLERALGDDLTAAVRDLAKRCGVTVATVFQGAFALLLARHASEREVVFGVVTSGRPAELPHVDTAVGLYVNTLPCRVSLDPRATVSAWLGALQREGAELRRFEHVSLADVKSWSDVPKDVALFDSLFVFENYPMDAFARDVAGPLSVTHVDAWEASGYALELAVVPRGTSLALRTSYDAARFTDGAIARATEHVVNLLGALTAAPDATLADIAMVSAAERSAVLDRWNATFADYARGVCLHDLFALQAAKTPDAIAVIDKDGAIRYADLDARSNALAHRLRALGVGPEVVVGIGVERSIDAVVGLLGILKAGGGYVPLDPAYPADRVAYMLADSKVKVVVTQRAFASQFAEQGATVVRADDLDGWSTEPVVSGVSADNVAYVIYTSGATGAPKGVVGPHAGIVNRLQWMWERFPFADDEMGCHKTSLNFLDSVWEIFGPLLQGIPAVAFDNDTGRDPFALVRGLAENGVTRIVLVPSLLRALADAANELGDRLPALRTWTTSGEALPPELAARFRATFPDATLLNLYGCSELAADSTYHVITAADDDETVLVGRPLANNEAYVVDARFQLVPVGVTGELCVAGVGLARGYLGRAELTAEKFVANPFGPGRLYRTGDLARWRDDGALEYVGRIDHQVKVRGLRIELGEIEAALAASPDVRQGLVVARDDGQGDSRLVAYVVPTGAIEDAAERLTDRLRAALGAVLPEYMVPSSFVFLARFPLTPSGKIARNALPAPVATRDRLAATYVVPSGETEQTVASVLAAVLGVPRIGANDAFLDLGGHSLLAMQAVARLHRATGVALPLRRFFAAPTVRGIAAALDELRTGGGTFTAIPRVDRTAEGGELALSFAQERLWFIDRYAPGSALYNVPGALRLRGPLDVEALRRAFETIVARHESLRTRLGARDGRAFQVIDAPEAFVLPRETVDSEDAAHHVAAREANRPFDLEAGPVLRAHVAKIGPEDHLLTVVLHHIVSDGWSLGVLVRELGALYRAFVRGEAATGILAPLPIQYADFAAWQRTALGHDALANDLAYWRGALAGLPALDLPTDRPRGAEQTFAGASFPVQIGRETITRLHAVCRAQGATLFMALLAGLEIVLGRYAGQDDFAVGSPIANRTRPELEELVGFFVNTLVLRADLSGAPSFEALLDRTRTATLGAYEHQEVPFEKVVGAVGLARDASRSPLFQVLFVLQNAPFERASLEGLASTHVAIPSSHARFDLTFALEEQDGEVRGFVEYNTDLFDRATVARMTASFVGLLDAAAKAPSTAIGALPLVTGDDLHQMTVAWNATATPFPADRTVDALFADHAARTPSSLAIVTESEALTYGDLAARANRIARGLQRRGVGKGAIVGVMFDRTPDLVASILGILGAGAAFLPLDPEHPKDRLAFTLEDAGVALLLSDRTEAALASVTVVTPSAFAGESEEALEPTAGPRDLAYVIYTSGSTGRPKGVLLEHAGLTNLAIQQSRAFGVRPESRVLQFASPSFDASVSEIVMALVAGAAIGLAPRERLVSPITLATVCRTLAIDVVTLPPALLALLEPADFPTLRSIVVAGETCSAAVVRRWLPVARVFNAYGPSEATVCTTIGECSATLLPPNIGRPMGNMRVYLVDDALAPVPVGAPGELLVGGVGVGRGYLNRPELDAAKFVADPFVAGERVYRTGDRARFRPDGTIEFLGRSDDQVKLRGYRIELGEIEAALQAQPDVKDAIVLLREDTPGDRRLVGYLVGGRANGANDANGASDAAASATLRAAIATTLPEYMVPSAFVWLEAFPRTPNGKVDRRALPAPVTIDRAARALPTTTIETALVQIWSEVLAMSPATIGIDDDFFVVGGHSLRAAQVTARVQHALGVALPLRAVFRHRTIRDLAAALETATDAAGHTSTTAIATRPSGAGAELPLSFGQERLWFLEQYEPQGATYTIASTFELDGALDVAALRAALDGLVLRHESLRTRIVTRDGRAFQVIDPPAPFALELAHATNADDALARATAFAQTSFDLASGPLFRGLLVEKAPNAWVLALAMHHAIADGWSMGVLFRELRALYTQSTLPALALQYADFAAWQRAHLAGERLATQVAYWKDALDGAASLELPTDRPRPAVMTRTGAYVTLAVPADVLRAFEALARAERATLFMALVATFQLLLGRYAGQKDVAVGTPVAGRTRRELEDVVGFFVNTLVLRSQFADEPSFRTLLGRVRAATLGALDHQDVPFEKLVDALGVTRDTSRTPIFQAMFSFDEASGAFELPGLTAKQIPLPLGTAKFELTLDLRQREGALEGVLEYNADLFDAATAERLAAHFGVLLAAAAASPDQPVSTLPLVLGEERERLLVTWNDTAADYPREATVHGLFEAQVAQRPDAIALAGDEGTMTFAELDARANALADVLVAKGAGIETGIGISSNRSFDLVVGLLGILKAGAAYVPLEPDQPAERLHHLVASAGVRLVVASAERAAELALPEGVIVVDPRQGHAAAPAVRRGRPDALVHVMFTSGSTGTPKGACLTHRNIAHISSAQSYVDLGADQVWAHYATTSFDATTLELWPSLLNGARVVLFPNGPFDLDDFADRLVRFGVTTAWITAGLFRRIVEVRLDALASVRQIMTGGDVVSPWHVKKLLEAYPTTRLINGYGPTENTVFTSFLPITPETPIGAEVPIGTLITNCKAYVLSDAFEPVPVGVVGQLYVTGEGMGRGYVDPSMTADRWLPNPFASEPGARMYRTGDLVRWRADGNLLFVGRVDDQVKVRGIRIELGEIEAAVLRCTGVRGTVVVVREDRPGDKRIVAYVVGDTNEAALRAELASRVTPYMMPAAIVLLEALPLTARGKVDRRALPAPSEGKAGDAPIAEPTTPVEHALLAVWRDVLGRERIGVHDGFFALGGDSILSIQVVARAAQRGIRITSRLLFQHPTIAGLAKVAVCDVREEQPLDVKGPVPLTPVQRWFFALGSPAPAHYNQSLLLAVDDLDADALGEALTAVVNHHDALRLEFRTTSANESGASQASVSRTQEVTPVLAKLFVDTITLGEGEDIHAAATEVQACLDIEGGTVFAAAVFERPNAPALLLLVAHHLVVDAVSWRIILEDLETAYAAARQKQAIALPAKTLSFAAWSTFLDRYATSERLAAELPYWQRIVDAPATDLPLTSDASDASDTSAATVTEADAATLSVALSAATTKLLLEVVPRAYGTRINDALLAALAEALGASEGAAVRIALEGHGREEDAASAPSLARTVGWHTSLFPVLLTRGADAIATFKETKDRLRAVPHNGIGYGVLRYLGGHDSLAVTPNVVFNYLGQLDAGVTTSAFAVTDGDKGLEHATTTPMAHALSVNACVRAGALSVEWLYATPLVTRDAVTRIADRFVAALEAIVLHASAPEASGYTASDFALAKLDTATLSTLLDGARRGAIADVLPLSPMQEGMLFHSLYAPEAGAYYEQLEVSLAGDVDPAALEAAFDDVVRVHDALRASFAWEGLPRPLQIIHAEAKMPFARHDAPGVTVASVRARRKSAGFDLTKAPLLCADLVRSEGKETLLLSFHHILLDGWSVARVFGDLFAAYAARADGKAPTLVPGPAYSAYIGWLEAQDPAATQEFWKRELRGFRHPTPLWGDKAPRRAASATTTHALLDRRLDRASTTKLEALAKNHGVTLATIVQGAWALLLARYAGEDDVVFGAVTSGRPAELPGVESAVGLFINTVAVRVFVDHEKPAIGWLEALQAKNLELRSHEHAHLSRVTSLSDVEPGAPLFESLFVFENYPVDESARSAGDRLGVTTVRAFETTNYPLVVIVGPGEELLLRLDYDTSRFDQSTVAKASEHLEALLLSIAKTPDIALGRLSMLSAREREQVTVTWNQTATELPLDRCLHEIFEDHASRRPEAIALVDGDVALDYAAVDRRANQLAHRLAAAGVGPDVVVALFMEKSIDAIVTILGIQKAGGAYLPVDPDYPADRVTFMVQDSGAKLIVTNTRLAERAASLGADVVVLDAPTTPAPSETRLGRRAGPDNLAYVIYTSGSTGRPKGAMLTHRGLTNLAVSEIARLGVGPDSRVLQFASLSFDASVWETAMAFAAGAALHIASRARIFDEGGLRKILLDEKIEVALLPPSVLPTLDPAEHTTLQTLLVGGESCPPALAARWALGRRLWNAYGPTEATVYSAIALCRDGLLPPIIGRAIANTQLYVCDKNLEPVPVGVPGELLIGGIGVARGYLHRPELTAERFVRDPFAADPEARLYRTGDLVRAMPDGNLEYLGRIDHQIKIRGHRIEVGEVEAALVKYPGLRDAVAAARTDERGDTRFVAWVVPAEGTSPSASELRAHLATTLPDHMLPAVFVVCAELPLTPNGKVDRKALPTPFGREAEAPKSYVAPVSPVEVALAEAWQEALRVPRVGRFDDFFELGGDSILSIQVVTRAAARGVRVSARDVFTHRTVARLAQIVASGRDGAKLAAQGEIVGEVPLLPIQRWFFERAGDAKNHFNMGLVLRTAGPVDEDALGAALDALVAHHDALRARFEGVRQTLVSADGMHVDVIAAHGTEAELEAEATAIHASLDVTNGPLLRAGVFTRDGEEGALVLLAIHHLVVDAVSLRILHEDLETAYAQAVAGAPIRLPLKTTSFKAWAEALDAASARLATQVDHWRGVASAQVSRVSGQEPSDTAATAETITVTLDAAATTALLREVPKAYRTQINDALLTGVVEALAGFTGGNAFRIDLEGHGREEGLVGTEGIDLSRTVGWFTSMYPVVLASDPRGIGSTLVDVKERLRAVPERGIGYGVLRGLGVVPNAEADVSFNYLGQIAGGASAETRGMFERLGIPLGKAASDRMPRRHAITINALVQDGVLTAYFTYGTARFEAEAVQALADAFVASLRAVIAHATTAETFGFTPSDFPLARLGQADLDRLAKAHPDVVDVYPLSPMQEALTFHAVYAEGATAYSSAYYEQSCLTLEGDVDAELLRAAWQDVVDAFPILRTSFVWEGLARPLQIVHANATVPFDVHDWRGKAPATKLEELAAERRKTGFDLHAAPLLRLDLARTREREWRLLVAFHHVLLDGWSAARVFAAVGGAYKARLAGRTFHAEAGTPFRAHIEWLERRDRDAERAFWKGELGGFESATPLWGDRAPKKRADDTTVHGLEAYTIAPATAAALTAMTRQRGLTLNTVVQGVWALLLSVYSGERDVVFGIVTSGRPSEVEGVDTSVGLFINTIPVRVSVDRRKPAATWLRELQAKNVTLRQYEHAPLAELQTYCDVPKGEPLFESIVVFENYPIDGDVEEGPFKVKDLRGWNRADLPIHVNVVPGRELALHVDYDTTRLDVARIRTMLAHFERALGEIARAPERPLGAVSLLGESERDKLLGTWNATRAAFPAEACLHHLFEAEAARAPAAIAVASENGKLTYAELDAEANRLARRLVKLGVGPEVRVGLGLTRTPSLIVAILAVLKAGGAYVPLDPAYPTDRLAYMASDSAIGLLVTEARVAQAFESLPAPRLFLDAPIDEASSRPAVVVSPKNLAYVIYTSGSTGRPKGVAVPHVGVVNMVAYERGYYGMGPETRMLQFASPSFDNSVEEIFDTLSTGGTLVLAPPHVMGSGPDLAAFLRKERVTTISLAPAALAALPDEDLPDLTTVIVGGDTCAPELARRWGRGRTFINSYGPTEATVAATLWKYAPNEGVSIGRPLANARVYVLDSELRPVPPEVAGELYIGGVGVTRGYVNAPVLTAERFFADPFATEPGARMYATGDLVRFRADGALEFLGRVDTQVKIRGFRIELGEIETALTDLPEVETAVVIARQDAGSDKQLVAYVTLKPGASLRSADARDRLKARLPAYAVPAHVEILDAMPLNTSGKIDRRALPAPGASRRDEVRVAPRNADERAVADVFRAVLRLEEDVAADDDFFALGGHSLLAVALMSRLEKHFGRKLPLQAVIADGTVEGIARQLRGETKREAPTSIVPLRDSGSKTPLFLVHPVGGSVFCYRAIVAELRAAQPVYALQSAHFAGREADGSIEAMARTYVAEVRRVQPRGPYRLGGWSMGGVVAWEMARQLRAAGEVVERLVMIDSHAPEAPIEAEPAKVRAAFDDHHRAGASDLSGAAGDVGDVEEVWPAFRDNLVASLAYAPEPFRQEIFVVRAAASPVLVDVTRWAAWSGDRIDVVDVDADHFGIVTEASAPVVAHAIERYLQDRPPPSTRNLPELHEAE